MAEFISIPEQTVAYGQSVQLNARRPCNKGYVLHREGAGIVTLRGIVNNPCAPSARYSVTFNGNIAIPTGGTVGEISVAIAIQGEPDGASLAANTPAAVDQYGNVTSTTQVDVPKGCCYTISVENTSETAEPILVRNANLVVNRIG
jgi:hypothetical protein